MPWRIHISTGLAAIGLLLAPGLSLAQPKIPRDQVPDSVAAPVRAQIDGLYSKDPNERADRKSVV